MHPILPGRYLSMNGLEKSKAGRKGGFRGQWAVRAGVIMTSLAALTGCAGYVGTGYVAEPYDSYGYYGPDYVPEPDIYVFGGFPHHRDFDHDHDRDFSHRGFESRRAMGPHATSHAGGFGGVSHGAGHGGGHR